MKTKLVKNLWFSVESSRGIFALRTGPARLPPSRVRC